MMNLVINLVFVVKCTAAFGKDTGKEVE